MKKIISFYELYQTEFHAHIFNAAYQCWRETTVFSCIDTPKECDMLLYLLACRGEYTTASGQCIAVPKNSIVYVPKDSRYTFRCFDIENHDANTIIINFQLTDESAVPFSIASQISPIELPNYTYFRTLFEEIADLSTQRSFFPCAQQAVFFRIFCGLCEHFHHEYVHSSRFSIIAPGIEYLETDESLELSVSALAQLCHVSTTYFEHLFKEYSGMTPVAFKLKKKIHRAKQCLAYENRTIKETAELLGFHDLPYFYRVFKKETGQTPGEYFQKIFL